MTLSDRDAQIAELYLAGLPVPTIASCVGRRCAYVQKVLGALHPERAKSKKRPAQPRKDVRQ